MRFEARSLVCLGAAVVVSSLLWLAPAARGAGEPQIGSAWTAGVGTTSAFLRAELDPNGMGTAYRFLYLSEAAFEANLGAGNDGFTGAAEVPVGGGSLGAGSGFVVVSHSIGPLTPDRRYRYRLVASNGAGAVVGATRSFSSEAFAGATPLLDARAYELVSPADKGSGEIGGPGQSFGGGVIQAAAGGDSMTFSSTSSFGPAPGAPAGSQYISRRGAGGWATENVTAATESGAYGDAPDGVPYQLFSGDLSRGLMLNGLRCAAGEVCPRSYAVREGATGLFTDSAARPDLRFAGAAADLSQIVLSTCAALTPDAIEVPGVDGCDPGQPNLYRWSPAGLDLINLLPAASFGTPGAALAAQGGAVSADGGRVYWTEGGNLFLREGDVSKQVDVSLGGGGTFEVASSSGATAYFSKAGHLYRYEPLGGSVTDLTPGGGLAGVLGASADGSRVYYVTGAGLFLRHGDAAPIEVADGAAASNYPPATGTARVTPDGTHLAFLSSASLTGHDNRDETTKQPYTQVFLYDAGEGSLTCASCNPTGERPLGPSTIPGATANGQSATATKLYKPRALSDDGRRLFFDSADAIAIADTAKRPDVYEWEEQGTGTCARPEGCVALISAGRNSEGASFLDASASGRDVFFLTLDSLVGSDFGFADVYDARAGGGFPEPSKPIECVGDACQFLPSEPDDPTPGSIVPSSGNPKPRGASSKCRKGKVRRQGRCVKKKRRGNGHRARGGGAR